MNMPDLTNLKPLKCQTKTVIKVGYSDLERYIKDISGKNVEIPCVLECGNDTDHEIDVGSHPEWLSAADKKTAEAFLFGDAKSIPTWTLNKLMETMHFHKLLEKGTYLISVSW